MITCQFLSIHLFPSRIYTRAFINHSVPDGYTDLSQAKSDNHNRSVVKNLRCFLSHFVFQHIRHVFAYSFLPSSLLRRLYYRRSSSITRRAKSHSRAHSHRSLTTESPTGDTRHVASSPSSSPVLVHLCTVYTTYGFLIVGSRSLLRGNVRLSRNRAVGSGPTLWDHGGPHSRGARLALIAVAQVSKLGSR